MYASVSVLYMSVYTSVYACTRLRPFGGGEQVERDVRAEVVDDGAHDAQLRLAQPVCVCTGVCGGA